MVTTPENWFAFTVELNEFKTLRDIYQNGKVAYGVRSSNTLMVFLHDMLERGIVFCHMLTSRFFTGLILSIHFLRIRNKIYLCIVMKKNLLNIFSMSITPLHWIFLSGCLLIY